MNKWKSIGLFTLPALTLIACGRENETGEEVGTEETVNEDVANIAPIEGGTRADEMETIIFFYKREHPQ